MNIVCQRCKALPGAGRGGRKGISVVQMVRKLTVFLLFCGLAGGAPAGAALATGQHDIVPASAALLPALGANRRGDGLKFAQYDTKLDKTGMDKKLDKTGMDKKLDKTGMDNPANAIRQTPPVGGEVVRAPPAPASAIRGSSGVTITNAPAEGAAIESSTGPTIMHAPGAAQE